MAITLDSITKGKAERAPRIVLLGTPKIGKSTFASQAPNPIFIPVKGEEGIDAIDTSSFPTANTFGEVMECITALYTTDHEYETVVIDSASTLEPIIWAETCRRHNVNSIETVLKGFGKGYIEAMHEWGQFMEGLDALRAERNMVCILIGHVKVKTFNDPTADAYDQYQWDIQARAASALTKWADSTLFAQRKAIVKTEKLSSQNKDEDKKRRAVSGGDPVLFTQERPAHPGGGRGAYGQLPHELPLNWPAFQSAVAEAANA